LIHPKIVKLDTGKNIVTEAHWIDPISGFFVRKGVVSIEPKNKENN
jgi:hypothetical protein